jgi:hypothetical protein
MYAHAKLLHSRRLTVRLGFAAALSASSSAPRRFDSGNVDFFHFHHRLERALGGRAFRGSEGDPSRLQRNSIAGFDSRLMLNNFQTDRTLRRQSQKRAAPAP